MLKKNLLMITVLLVACFTFSSQSSAIDLMESFFLKITVVENGVEHEWEYTSPGKYEYEQGEKVIKTNVAKDTMLSIVKTIQLSEKAKIEDMVHLLKEERFPNLERLEIRWMNGESKLYTWVWDKNN